MGEQNEAEIARLQGEPYLLAKRSHGFGSSRFFQYYLYKISHIKIVC